jgi:hypothetical protein
MQKEIVNYSPSKFDSFLIQYAKTIDDVDMFISPLSTLSVWHKSELVHKIGIGLTIFDIAILKTPFVAMYIAKTKDYKSAIEWLGWEALSHAIPYEGGLLNIRRNYENNTNEYYEKKKELNTKIEK